SSSSNMAAQLRLIRSRASSPKSGSFCRVLLQSPEIKERKRSQTGPNVRFWPIADIPIATPNVIQPRSGSDFDLARWHRGFLSGQHWPLPNEIKEDESIPISPGRRLKPGL